MSRKVLLVITKICFLFLLVLPAAYAEEPVVSPTEGTIGTTFTITGSDLGAKEGLVLVGSVPCDVLAWSDTSIVAFIRTPMRPGTYDLVLKTRGGAWDSATAWVTRWATWPFRSTMTVAGAGRAGTCP